MALIREYRPEDGAQVERCFVELQSFERGIQPLRAEAKDVSKKYLEFMFKRASETGGKVFVAESESEVIGFVCLWLRVPENEFVNMPGEYAYVSDLVLLPDFRGRKLGYELLKTAERYAVENGATRLKLGVLAGNSGARRLYEKFGFTDTEVYMSKKLDAGSGDA
ncbi:MAG TPA: GNAT family N-acetyltransferase [Pyrinomonadaceae bacterium]|nr:GNAT family N-acetyltransferase [Pyrinomonadaceae bacterium]